MGRIGCTSSASAILESYPFLKAYTVWLLDQARSLARTVVIDFMLLGILRHRQGLHSNMSPSVCNLNEWDIRLPLSMYSGFSHL